MLTLKKSKEELAAQAFKECTSAETAVHPGGGPGHPYWNARSSHFMYVPSFQFPWIPDDGKYRYTCEDENGKLYKFETLDPSASLEPIWRDIPDGIVKMRVTDLNEDGSDKYLVGARTFFKASPFPADLPPAARSYREAAMKGFEYMLNEPFMKYWKEHGAPDPTYNLNVYPSKMISAIIKAMRTLADFAPEKENDAREIALAAADYLLSIFYPEGSALAGLPPTYYIDFRENPEKYNNMTADDRKDTLMTIYPADVATAFLSLYDWVGEKRFYDAAYRIACYYRDHVLPNGSWPLIISVETGEARSANCVLPTREIVPLMMNFYNRTGDEIWKQIADNGLAYDEETVVKPFNFEGQFEDSVLSANYSNLSHIPADALADYYFTHYADDPKRMATAIDMVRFAEDQFVLWKKAPSWHINSFDTSKWFLPAALEQYNWYVPIDASNSLLSRTFLSLYRATGDELALAKSMALADQITRMQLDNGMIPTHWMDQSCIDCPDYFWINCHISSVITLANLSSFIGEND